ncbi:MAG TPA: phosphoribosylanthranilate isomerase [Steroidobacteraceae bacterium]|nr:phosphoribosylanthranilate isomerase [Steroidobacteraceae bacterium]
MWIKICGMTTPEAVAAALAARVDAIGFVFTDSPRQLTLEDAVALAAPARGRVRCVAVTRHPSQRHLDDVLAVFRPDVLQTDTDDLRVLKLPKQLELLPVYRAWEGPNTRLPARLLFEGPTSGSGVPCDWTIAQRMARRTQLVLAGGLDASNVATAIGAVRPFGVDVSSGVEERPGVKSPAEVVRFAAAARGAFEMIQQEQRSA